MTGSTGIEQVRIWFGVTWFRRVAAAVATLCLALALTLAGVAWAWGDALRTAERLLPGVSINGLHVGGATAASALETAQELAEPALDRPLGVRFHVRTWTTTPRELGAATNAEAVVTAAIERTTSASLAELARYRWLGHEPVLAFEAGAVLSEAAAAHFVDAAADSVDRAPTSAGYRWVGDTVTVVSHRSGLEVDRRAAVAALRDAVAAGAATVELPVRELAPQLTAAAAERALGEVRDAVDAALDRPVTLTHSDRRWTVTARALDAVPDLEPITAAVADRGVAVPALATPAARLEGRSSMPAVPVAPAGHRLAAYVDVLAGEIHVAPRDAQIAWTGAGLRVTGEASGIALDRDLAARAITAALAGDRDELALPVDVVHAEVTTRSFTEVLVVRQDLRMLELHRHGEVVHEWPVAVGQGGSPTPTGVFQVGAKRFEPTWYNPDPTGWGRDMPRVVGPGPTNPLGLRALNWERNGADTLIRFHGTPNEASIGSAASRGCVRMFNRDAIELYDLVESGTFIVSVAN